MEERTFVYTYPFRGERWSILVTAPNRREARYRLQAMSMAVCSGELVMSLPSWAGFVAKWVCRIRNFFK